MMKEEIFCLDCEVLINRPSFLDMFAVSPNVNKPVKFKSGWVCNKCSVARAKK